MPRTRSDFERIIDQGLGRTKADLVIKNARILDLGDGAIEPSDIAVCGDRIVGTYESYTGTIEIDAGGRIAVPGFIDTHVHCESTLVTPHEFERCVLPRGTTTAICDPHEICNVLGTPGLEYFLDAARATTLDLRVQLSSCVPATHLETAGATLAAADLVRYAGHEKVIGLAELMNFRGLLAKDRVVLDKLAAFAGAHIDGHCPLLGGRELNAYIACGIRNCHETTTAAEAREKLKKGLQLLIREGTVSKDVAALAPLITRENSPFVAFCTDDRNPLDIAEEGHIDFLIREAIRAGAPAMHVYRAATWSAAQSFGLRDRGRIAPGLRADIVLLDDLAECRIDTVIVGGQRLGDVRFSGSRPAAIGLDSIRLDSVTPEIFAVPASGPSGPVIGVTAGTIVTEFATLALPLSNGTKLADAANDVLKVAVLARHGRNRNVGRGFVRGFGIRAGALASSVGHDSHNVCVIGSNDADMAAAVNRLIEIRGGFVAARDGNVLAELPLPIAGLMSDRPFEEVAAMLRRLRAAVREMGSPLPEPFLQMAFLPLPVIPRLRITDRGLVDVERFELIAA